MVVVQNIDGSSLETFKIIMVFLLIDDKVKRIRFFTKEFLLVDISINIVLAILFPVLFNVKITFNNKKLKLRLYTTIEALFTTKEIILVGKKCL